MRALRRGAIGAIERKRIAVRAVRESLSSLGEPILFDLEGFRDRMNAHRPMPREYARKYLQVTLTSDPSAALGLAQAAAAVAADSDPISDATADQVVDAVVAALGAENATSTELDRQTQEAKQTYEFWKALPSNIGGVIGAGIGATAEVAGSGILALLKSFFTTPAGIAVGALGAYLLLRRKRRVA